MGSAIGIAVIGTVLFGTLHVLPGPDAVAAAFSHSAQLALLANVGLVVVALVLVLALPRQIPGPVAVARGAARYRGAMTTSDWVRGELRAGYAAGPRTGYAAGPRTGLAAAPPR